MILKLKEIWDEKGFEIILCLCIGFILVFGIYHLIKKQKGTFSKSNYYTYLPAKSYNYQTPTKQTNKRKESKACAVLTYQSMLCKSKAWLKGIEGVLTICAWT